MDEIRGAVGLIQLKKLPDICTRMRTHQQRLKAELDDINGIEWRKIIDPNGDSGFMIGWMHKDKMTAKLFKEAMNAEGIPVATAPGGIHQFRNITNINKIPFTTAGCPWSCPFNKDSNTEYSKDMLPQSDDILDRSLCLAMPPLMTEEDEKDAINAFRKVAQAIL